MRARVTFVPGYGWHCGRPAWALVLWPTGLIAPFIAIPLELLLRELTRLPLPFALLLPAAFAATLARRLRRKLAGEPFVVDEWGVEANEITLVRRTDDPERFRRLVGLEVLLWGVPIAFQVGMLLLWYTRDL